MTGGYILLDLTKYNLESDISALADLNEDNQITKDEFDTIMKKCKLSFDTAKPLHIKTNTLYDNNSQKNINALNIYYDDDVCIIPYIDISDSNLNIADMYIHIKKYNNNYYVFATSSVFN